MPQPTNNFAVYNEVRNANGKLLTRDFLVSFPTIEEAREYASCHKNTKTYDSPAADGYIYDQENDTYVHYDNCKGSDILKIEEIKTRN